MDRDFHSFSFRLTSPLSYVELPRKLDSMRKLKVKALKYITKTLNNEYMLINIVGWNFNSSFFASAGQHKNYTKYLPLNGTTETQNFYINNNSVDFDVIRPTAVGVGNLTIEITIDGQYSTDITTLNPVLLELYFES